MVRVLMKKSNGGYQPQHGQGGCPYAHQVWVLAQKHWKWGWVPQCTCQQLTGLVSIWPGVIRVVQVVCGLVRISPGVMGHNTGQKPVALVVQMLQDITPRHDPRAHSRPLP